MSGSKKAPKIKSVSYSKYGYLFILPFFLAYAIFQLWPLFTTFYYSLFQYTTRNLRETVTFAGLQNYKNLLGLVSGERAYFLTYLGNTLAIWLVNFVPQILLALIIAAWLTDSRVRLRGGGLVKVMVYMPNIITAASIAILFNALFTQYGPIMSTLKNWGWVSPNFDLLNNKEGTRAIISFILFWMWYGNTTLLLIAGMLGINPSLYESADIDGASAWTKFKRITLPLLKPVMLYVLVTSVIGGLQMYDIPALFNVNPGGGLVGLPDDTSTTVTMYIMRLRSSDLGRSAAVSVMLFLITLVVSLIFFYAFRDRDRVSRRRRHLDLKGGERG